MGLAEQVMAPFTPFITEHMYQNLRRALPPDSPQSVHWRNFPAAAASQVPRVKEKLNPKP